MALSEPSDLECPITDSTVRNLSDTRCVRVYINSHALVLAYKPFIEMFVSIFFIVFFMLNRKSAKISKPKTEIDRYGRHL